MHNLLRRYIRTVIEARLARVPQQLVSADSSEHSDEGHEDEGTEECVQEFSAAGSGAVAGYSLPLGMNPDAVGRKKNRTKKR